MWLAIMWIGNRCEAETGYSTYFGDLHAHTAWSADGITSEQFEAAYDIDHMCDFEEGHHKFECLASTETRMFSLYNTYLFGMENAKLDFVAITDHIEEGHPAQYHRYNEIHDYFDFLRRAAEDISAYCEDNDIDFVPFMGCEWTNHVSEGDTLNNLGQGHRNIIFKNLQNLSPFLECSSDKDSSDTMWEMWEAIYNSPLCYDSDGDSVIDATDVILVAHHPAKENQAWVDWSTIYPDKKIYYELLEPIMEIYSEHGNSESDSTQFDPYAFSGYVTTSTAQYCLDAGIKIGIGASTDNHESEPGSVHNGDAAYPGFPCNGGITGVHADDDIVAEDGLREAIWEAIGSRRVYGTSGPKMVVELNINDGTRYCTMGSELTAIVGSPLLLVVSAESSAENGGGYLTDPVNITSVELISNEDGILKETEIATPNSSSCFVTKNIKPAGNCFYYVRITQIDDAGIEDKAWSSPIWIKALPKDSSTLTEGASSMLENGEIITKKD